MAFYDDEELMLPLSSKKKKKAKDLSRMIPLKILKMSKAYIACDEYDDPSATTSSDYSTDDDRTNAFINARRHFMRMIDRAVLNLTEDDDPDDHDSHKTEEGTNFKGFYNNVANGKYRNPWIRESMPTKRLEKRLTFLIRMQLLKVGHQEYGIDFGEPVEQHLKAEESLTRFENELVDSLCKIGGFGRDVLNRTKENPVKTPLTKIQALHVFDGAIGHICQSEHCEFSYDTPNRFYRECFYQLEQAEPISEGIFRESKNAPIKLDRNATVIYRTISSNLFFICLF
ncbi:hypothetical protein WR25_20914 [Diploscapter pachys]|uniref:Uncharacterized protein n=1 Tax=Diploscapter pachys TaxID=2018661 RepID=A0A2A2JDZ8_9BILA|nr:hypothetical protein WR25_20914 [Diploscapter pachys]